MNSLTEQLQATYNPKMAIVVYHKQLGEEYYLESHEIENGRMGAGKPLDERTIRDLVKYFADDYATREEIRGAIPKQLLYCEWNPTRKVMVWYNEPQERMMHFTGDLHIGSGTAMQPGLIYVKINNSLKVYATKAKGRPSEKEKLYIPPYHNCSSDGSVCLGSARVAKPKPTYEGYIAYHEQMFWGSEFSHLAARNSNMKDNINLYWKRAIKSKTAFDTSLLVPTKLTLDKLIK